MKYVLLENLVGGEIVASDIFSEDGRILVTKDSVLTEIYKRRLMERGCRGAYVVDGRASDFSVPQYAGSALTSLVRESFRVLMAGDNANIRNLAMNDIMEHYIEELNIEEFRDIDDYTYNHSIRVAILCAVMGAIMELSQEEINSVIVAALLQDIGKLKLPGEIINKHERLTGEEYEIMKSHVVESVLMIKDREDITEMTKKAILMHHENEDASGYPSELSGKNITLLAKILHIADVYDALVTTRPFKRGFTPREAVEYLMGGAGIYFDKKVVDAFIRCVPVYPLGMKLRLSNNIACKVIANRGQNNLRPIVETIPDMRVIDLVEPENLSLVIGALAYNDEIMENEEQRREMIDQSKKSKIVIVDDMKTNLQMLKEILTPQYNVIPFKSGPQTLKYLETHRPPELFILDIDMPEMRGTELAAIINKMYDSRIPILIVSALVDRETILLCKQLGAKGYVARPYQPAFVASEVERILEGKVIV